MIIQLQPENEDQLYIYKFIEKFSYIFSNELLENEIYKSNKSTWYRLKNTNKRGKAGEIELSRIIIDTIENVPYFCNKEINDYFRGDTQTLHNIFDKKILTRDFRIYLNLITFNSRNLNEYFGTRWYYVYSTSTPSEDNEFIRNYLQIEQEVDMEQYGNPTANYTNIINLLDNIDLSKNDILRITKFLLEKIPE